MLYYEIYIYTYINSILILQQYAYIDCDFKQTYKTDIQLSQNKLLQIDSI